MFLAQNKPFIQTDKHNFNKHHYRDTHTVNSEIFARILFRDRVKNILATLKISGQWHGLPTSDIDRVILRFREGLLSWNFAYAKFLENKTLAEISEFIVCEEYPLSHYDMLVW